jgi:hypothetical protein
MHSAVVSRVAASLAAAAFVVACHPGKAIGPAGAVDGTYDLTICRGACLPGDSATTLVRGRLVLEEGERGLAGISEPALRYLRRFEPHLFMGEGTGAPNACFVYAVTGKARTYAGGSKVAFTRWERDDSARIAMPFYRSADAGYAATFRIRGDRLAGSGRSWGGYGEGDALPRDSLIGRRIGPPDRSVCVRAAEAELDAFERRRGEPVP